MFYDITSSKQYEFRRYWLLLKLEIIVRFIQKSIPSLSQMTLQYKNKKNIFKALDNMRPQYNKNLTPIFTLKIQCKKTAKAEKHCVF